MPTNPSRAVRGLNQSVRKDNFGALRKEKMGQMLNSIAPATKKSDSILIGSPRSRAHLTMM